MNLNVNCGGGHCTRADSEVRVLPISTQPGSRSNSIVCRSCFDREITWRRDRNKSLSADAQFALPKWEDLEVYGGAP